jgi:hypothetical protein
MIQVYVCQHCGNITEFKSDRGDRLDFEQLELTPTQRTALRRIVDSMYPSCPPGTLASCKVEYYSVCKTCALRRDEMYSRYEPMMRRFGPKRHK